MTKDEARATVVGYWLAKADSSLAAARSELTAGRFDSTINRAYYAAFYGVSAVLLQMGKRFVKHSGVKASMHRELVKPGILGAGLGKAYDRLFENRTSADYAEFASFELEEVEDLVQSATDIVEEMKRLAGVPRED